MNTDTTPTTDLGAAAAPKRRRAPGAMSWVALCLAAIALVMSFAAVGQASAPGPRGPQGATGAQGIPGPAGPAGPRGHRGLAGADGTSVAAPASTGGGGAVDEKQQACIDTFTGTLTQAQIDQYCAPGGLYYGAGTPGG